MRAGPYGVGAEVLAISTNARSDKGDEDDEDINQPRLDRQRSKKTMAETSLASVSLSSNDLKPGQQRDSIVSQSEQICQSDLVRRLG